MNLREAGADEADVFDFLVEYERDHAAGRAPGLAHYLARFPGSEEAVAREYLALADEPNTTTCFRTISSVEVIDGDA